MYFILMIVYFLKKSNMLIFLYIYLTFIKILYNYGCSFYNLSYYYSEVAFLNTKNNLMVVFIFLFIFLLNTFRLSLVTHKFFFFAIYTYLFNCNIFMEMNVPHLEWLVSNTNNVNTNLLNGLMLIHPNILYFFYILFSYNILIKYTNSVWINFVEKISTYTTKYILYSSIIILILAICLGCWWAEQELGWGGWWSWDFIELLVLIFLFLMLSNMHTTIMHMDFLKNVKLFFCVLFISLFSVRFNIISSIHNFTSLDSQNQFFYYIMIAIIVFLFNSYFYINMYFGRYNTTNIFLKLYVLVILLYYLANILQSVNVGLISCVNIKSLYIYITVLVVFIMSKKNYNTLFIFGCTFFLINYNYISYLDYTLLLTLIYLALGFSRTVKLIHLICISLFIVVLHQLYNFYKSVGLFCNHNFFFFKTSCNITTMGSNITLKSNDFFEFKTQMYIYPQHMVKVDGIVAPFFEKVFEKKIIFLDFFKLQEVYNYNLQSIFLENNAIIFILLFLLNVVCFLNVFKKKNYKELL